MLQVELPKRGDSYALGRKLPAEERSSFFEGSARPEFEGSLAFEEVGMDLVELAGNIYLPASLLRNGLSADVLDLVISKFDASSNELVGAELLAVGGRSHCMEPQQQDSCLSLD